MTAPSNACPEAMDLRHQVLLKAPDAILLLDAAGRIRCANESARRQLGYSRAELTARSIYEVDAGTMRNKGLNLHQMYFPDDGTAFETQFRTSRGEWLPVEVNAAALVHEGQPYICIFARDMSACRLAERKSRQSEERLRAIGQALPDLVFVMDEEGRHLEVLTAHKNLLFAPVDHILNRRLHEIFDSRVADRFLNLIRQTIQSRTTGVIEYELAIGDALRTFEARTAPLDHPIHGKRCCVWIARDITERKNNEDLARQNLYLQEQLESELNYGEIVGASEPMKAVFRYIEMVAATEATVLLIGETGTGKELIARAIHQRSRRRERVMIKVDCGALPAGLIESELFGHEKGAFTGAAYQKKGRFELAHHGTLFLDEVGELPPDTQAKLLRVLQEQEFERVGGERTLKVDVRIIAATNRDLEKAVASGRFRADLYYRLNIFPIHIPPLRERKKDIPLLTHYFIKKFCGRLGRQIKDIHPTALEKLQAFFWPGNVRELANILERAVILCDGDKLHPAHFASLGAAAAPSEAFPSLKDMERRHILEALQRTAGVLAGPRGAAALLGVNRSTLWSRMRRLGISASKTYT